MSSVYSPQFTARTGLERRAHWAWITSLTIAIVGGLNFVPGAFLWVLQLVASPGEEAGFLFFGLMLVSLVGTVALSLTGMGFAIESISCRRHSTAAGVIVLTLNAAPVLFYMLIFGMSALIAAA